MRSVCLINLQKQIKDLLGISHFETIPQLDSPGGGYSSVAKSSIARDFNESKIAVNSFSSQSLSLVKYVRV